jgi:L-aspartate oxidase
VFLSLRGLDPDYVHRRFPLIADACRRAGLDLARDPIPVGPAAHYVMGGVVTDLDGRTTLPGLFAAGEVACTGVHGANRLASNSLLEGLVFGARVGKGMKSFAEGAGAYAEGLPAVARSAKVGAGTDAEGAGFVDGVRDLMWRNVGLFRTREAMQRAVDELESAWLVITARIRAGGRLAADEWKAANLVTVARLIARAALRREESRGAHYRDDYPARDDIHWKKRISETIDQSISP